MSHTPVPGATPGPDTIVGTEADEDIPGLAGDDWPSGEGGGDILRGQSGNDRLSGGSGQDLLFGGTGDDMLFVGSDDDTLRGGAGHDTLHGGNGRDTLVGGNGNDQLFGDAGNDVLVGGLGSDTPTGGPGADNFRFAANDDAADLVADMVAGEDRIGIAAARIGGALPAGALDPARFVTGTASGSDGQFVDVCDAGADEGRLFWDADGDGPGGGALIARFAGDPGIGAGDIYIFQGPSAPGPIQSATPPGQSGRK